MRKKGKRTSTFERMVSSIPVFIMPNMFNKF